MSRSTNQHESRYKKASVTITAKRRNTSPQCRLQMRGQNLLLLTPFDSTCFSPHAAFTDPLPFTQLLVHQADQTPPPPQVAVGVCKVAPDMAQLAGCHV